MDWHSHAWLPEHLGPEWGAELDAYYGHVPSGAGSIDAHGAAMAAASVDACVVIGLCSDHFELDIPNEYVARCVEEFDGTAVGVAGIDPNRASAVAEVAHARDSLGLRGVKLAPPYQAFHPHAREAYEVYEAVAARDMFLIFHQGGVTHRRGVLEVAQPVLLDRVARDFPDTPIIVAHLGQPWYFEVIPLLRKHPNVYADLSARCSRPAQLLEMLKLARDYGVWGKLVWGSDFPVFDPGEHSAKLLEVAAAGEPGIDRPALEEILYERPLSLLGLDGLGDGPEEPGRGTPRR